MSPEKICPPLVIISAIEFNSHFAPEVCQIPALFMYKHEFGKFASRNKFHEKKYNHHKAFRVQWLLRGRRGYKNGKWKLICLAPPPSRQG